MLFLCFSLFSCHPSLWKMGMKPKHQVAAYHSDTYCRRAAASSPRGWRGSAGMEGGGGGDGGCSGTSVHAVRLSLPSIRGKGRGGAITVSQQRKMEGGGRSCRVEIMGGKPIAGKRKDNTETPLGEEVGGKWDIKQRYNINVNVTYANRCSPILFRAVNFIWIIQGQSGRLIKTRFYQHVTPGRFSWKPFRKHINTTKTIVATKGHHWQVKEVQSVRENSLEVRSSSPPNPLPRPSQMAMAIVHYHKHQTCKKQLFWQLDTEQNGGISLWLVGFWTSHNRNAFHKAFTSWFNSKQRHLYGL